MKKWIFIAFIFPSLLFPEEIPVIKAKYQETLKDRHIAKGEVSVYMGDTRIYSDELEYNFEKKTITARGNVVVDMPGQSITAKEIFLNLDEKTGGMKNVFIMNEQGLFIKAANLRKESENIYKLKNAIITSCTQPNPRWSIHSKNLKLKKDDYVDIWGAKFQIKSFPLLYLPYLRYPLPKEGRKTGFLIPQIGHSELKGYSITEEFFWAMSRSSDISIYVEFFSKAGKGIGAELRWRTFKGFGNSKFYYFLWGEGKKDYQLNLNLREELPWSLLLTSDVNWQSSFNFYSQFMNDINKLTQSVSSSSVNLSKSIGFYSFHLRVDRNESFLYGISSVVSRTPQIKFSRLNTRLFNLPFSLSFDSSFENFSKKDSEGSISFPYLRLSPSLSLTYSFAPWLSISDDINYSFEYFGKSFDTSKRAYSEERFSRGYLISRLTFLGPSFYRIFQSRDLKLKHLIEPRIVYSISSKESPSEIISPFKTDPFHQVNELYFSITNRVLRKFGKQSPSEFISFDISQRFFFNSEDKRTYSDIDFNFRTFLSSVSFMEIRTSYDPEKKGFLSSFLTLSYSSGNTLLRASWSRERKAEGNFIKTFSNHGRLFASFKVPYLPVDFAGEANYDFKSKKMLNQSYRIGYTYQCINFSLEYLYLSRPERDKKDRQFRLNIGLANIGVAQDMFGGRGF